MRVVVDTNVIAYYLLGTEPFQEECKDFWRRADTALAPASWQAELVNVLWVSVRGGVLDAEHALERLVLARTLGVHSVAVDGLWHGALVRAHRFGVAAYDTLFVELAAREGLPLATFDRKILETFPTIAKRPAEIVA